MHVAVVTQPVPNPDAGGHMLAHWAIIKWLRERSHRVTNIAIVPHGKTWLDVPRRLETLRQLGVEVLDVPLPAATAQTRAPHQRVAAFLQPAPAALFPTMRVAATVQAHLERIQPDVVLAGNYEGLAVVDGFTRAPIMVLFGDPHHLVVFHRWWAMKERVSVWVNLKTGAGVLRLVVVEVPQLRRMLRRCAAVGATAAHHAAWFGRLAGQPCLYLPSPVEDRAGAQWRERRAQATPNRVPRVLAIGHLGQTVTLPGIRMFLRDVLPVLDRELGPDGVEVHFIGHTKGAPAELLRLAERRQTLRIRGFVEPIDDDLWSAEVVLALNPTPLGNRLRIATAFAFGCCVVSHQANQLGMPALRHDHNVLLADTGRGVARQLVRALRDPELRQRLGAHARSTYEREYGNSVCARVEEQLQVLVRGGEPAVPSQEPALLPAATGLLGEA